MNRIYWRVYTAVLKKPQEERRTVEGCEVGPAQSIGGLRVMVEADCDSLVGRAKSISEAGVRHQPVGVLSKCTTLVTLICTVLLCTVRLGYLHLRLTRSLRLLRRHPKASEADSEVIAVYKASAASIMAIRDVKQSYAIASLPLRVAGFSLRTLKRYLDDVAVARAAEKVMAGLAQYEIEQGDEHILTHAT